MTAGRMADFLDPEGVRFGLPTYPWRCAPEGLATRRQLAAAGLRPGGQPVAAQLLWRSHRYRLSQHVGVRTAYLFRVDLARPRRAASPRQLDAIAAANRARRLCPSCGVDAGYVIPRHLGECLDCAAGEPAGGGLQLGHVA